MLIETQFKLSNIQLQFVDLQLGCIDSVIQEVTSLFAQANTLEEILQLAGLQHLQTDIAALCAILSKMFADVTLIQNAQENVTVLFQPQINLCGLIQRQLTILTAMYDIIASLTEWLQKVEKQDDAISTKELSDFLEKLAHLKASEGMNETMRDWIGSVLQKSMKVEAPSFQN